MSTMEDGTISVSYQMNLAERMELSWWLFKNIFLRRQGIYLVILLAFLLWVVRAYNLDLFTGMTGIIIVLLLLLDAVYILSGKAGEGKVTVKDGLFELGEKGRVSCSAFNSVKAGRRVIILKSQISKNTLNFFAVPVRVFSSSDEKEKFIDAFRDAKPVEKTERSDLDNTDWKFQFVFQMDQKSLKQVQKVQKPPVTEGRAPFLKQVIMGVMTFFGVVISVCCILLFLKKMGFVPCVIAVALILLVKIFHKKGEDTQPKDKDISGQWEVKAGSRGIYLSYPHRNLFFEWGRCGCLLESEDFLVFRKEYSIVQCLIPKSAFADKAAIAEFVAFCQGRGICWMLCEAKKSWKERLADVSGYIAGSLVAALMLGMCTLSAKDLLLRAKQGENNEIESEEVRETEQASYIEEVFQFDPSLYPGYVPLNEQIEVLSALGLEVPEQTAEDYRSWMSKGEERRIYAEGYPYTGLLIRAANQYTDETAQTLLCDVVYFNLDTNDAAGDYINILNHITALGEGERLIADIQNEKENLVDLTFNLGGIPCSFTEESDSERLNTDIIRICNDALGKKQSSKYLYMAEDGVQGILLFYNTPEWAEEFSEKTGLTLSREANLRN